MSATRGQLVADLLALVSAAAPAATVGAWKGDEVAFNESAVTPSVWVAYLGTTAGPDDEVGAVTYGRRARLAVYVCTADDVTDGHEEALGLLDTLEAALAGATVGEGGLEFERDALEWAQLGRYKFVQTYAVEEMR